VSSAAARERAHRRRMREGKIVVAVEVDVDDIEMLTVARLLDPMVDHDRVEVGHAIERVLKLLGRDASRLPLP
jgi:hypothetical protein